MTLGLDDINSHAFDGFANKRNMKHLFIDSDTISRKNMSGKFKGKKLSLFKAEEEKTDEFFFIIEKTTVFAKEDIIKSSKFIGLCYFFIVFCL